MKESDSGLKCEPFCCPFLYIWLSREGLFISHADHVKRNAGISWCKGVIGCVRSVEGFLVCFRCDKRTGFHVASFGIYGYETIDLSLQSFTSLFLSTGVFYSSHSKMKRWWISIEQKARASFTSLEGQPVQWGSSHLVQVDGAAGQLLGSILTPSSIVRDPWVYPPLPKRRQVQLPKPRIEAN